VPDTRSYGAANNARFGTWVMLTRDPAVLPLLKKAGLDYVRYDMEHTPIALESIAELVGVARSAGIGLCVRPPSGSEHWISALIVAGVRDLYIPQVHSAEAARAIVRAARRAGAEFPSRPDLHIAVMLESIASFREIDEIANVDGIDTLAIGPADLAQELGVYGTADEGPVTDEYRMLIRKTALARGKNWEMGVWSEADAARWLDAGCRLLTYQTETMIWREAYAAAAKTVARQTETMLRAGR
jgi:2-keto-3-deoxy-L-rhamnonate aldolase RhmA